MTSFDRLFVKVVQDNVARYVTIATSRIISQIAKETAGEAGETIAGFADALPLILARNRPKLAAANQASAIRAQRAILNRYLDVTSGSPPSYRQGQNRLSGGLLLSALSDPGFLHTSYDRVYFINEDLLDRQAAHWYRLNFGAGSGESSTVSAPLSFFGQSSGLRFGWANRRASKGFFMPAGGWTEAGQFYPQSQLGSAGVSSLRRTSYRSRVNPIKARGFLEPGIRTLARELPKGFEEYLTESTREAVRVGGKYWSSRKSGRRTGFRFDDLS